MKKLGFLLIILSLTIIFGACPPLEEDDLEGISVTFDEPFVLDVYKWFEILDDIAKERKYVKLDLSKGTYDKDNKTGGLIEVTVTDGVTPVKYIAFDPFPAASSGKSYILSIILPTEAQMIYRAKEDGEIIDDEKNIADTKKFSAFRSFTNLRSIKADNVTLIGNFAFADCTTLSEVNFPRVGHTVLEDELKDPDKKMANGYRMDIGKYAFLGCTNLKEVRFNSAAVIGGYAFKDCTGLSKIDFPEVWTVENNAFDGCVSLVNVFFEKASKIGEKAFKNCTGLKKAEFNVKPERFSKPSEPLDEDPCVFDSVIFYPSVFTGCKSLEVLNVRRAWNVFFHENVFAYTGSAVEIYLFDEPSAGLTSYGHPQTAMFLGDGALATTLKRVTIFVPADGEKIIKDILGTNNIAEYILTYYPKVDVNINRRTM